jgi:hypothetical protein
VTSLPPRQRRCRSRTSNAQLDTALRGDPPVRFVRLMVARNKQMKSANAT